MFVVRVVLLILGTVLVPTSDISVNVKYISVLANVRRIPKRKETGHRSLF